MVVEKIKKRSSNSVLRPHESAPELSLRPDLSRRHGSRDKHPGIKHHFSGAKTHYFAIMVVSFQNEKFV